jgi:hypothetical protein
MTTLRFLTAASLLAVSLAALPAADLPKDIVEIDFVRAIKTPDGGFQRAYDNDWDDWQGTKKVAQIPEKGLLLNHVGCKGGLGEDRTLDFRKHSKARILFVLGNGNQATSIIFSLVDKDGTDQAYEIPLADQPRGTPISYLIDLTQPSRVDKPGKVAGLDLKKLRSWQLKGNYGDAPIEILITKVLGVSQ